ncbi:hypothetical protein J6590_037863 [Homalodisca vitripennis]|nr:hypothetical protein J6590_037863 [Homalodisca vitripennis]
MRQVSTRGLGLKSMKTSSKLNPFDDCVTSCKRRMTCPTNCTLSLIQAATIETVLTHAKILTKNTHTRQLESVWIGRIQDIARIGQWTVMETDKTGSAVPSLATCRTPLRCVDHNRRVLTLLAS